MELVDVNIKTEKFAELIRDGKRGSYEGNLKIGVDLGTANIVIAAVDMNDEPVAGVSREAKVVRDGIVVDYIGAVEILKELKTEIEGILGMELNSASTAIPPGIMEGNTKVICNVVEAAGFLVTEVVDEPTAAARVLGINEGIVVDVGGACSFERFESVFEKYLKINIVKPNNPLLITPLGIAMYSK